MNPAQPTPTGNIKKKKKSVPRVPYSIMGFYALCTMFGRMPGFEPKLLRLEPGVLYFL